MIVELINTGSELMLGRVLNTHQQWICRRLADLGYPVSRQVAIPDTGPEIQSAVREALSRADLVITTGGLGPTSDDLTRELIAKLLGRPLREDSKVADHIRRYFISRRRNVPETTLIQAQIPEGALVLHNAFGTAPGTALKIDPNPFREPSRPSWLIMLPGPPRELQPMFINEVPPLLERELPLNEVFVCHTWRTTGMGESVAQQLIAEPLGELVAEGLDVGYCARPGQVDVRLSAQGSEARALVAKAADIVRTKLGKFVFGRGDEDLETVIVRELTERHETLALAESCTGGRIANLVTNVPGASNVLLAGWVPYSNEAKRRCLGVSAASLEAHGAVSEPVARELAEGARREAGATHALSVTGIAGPGGGSPEKPVGTVFIGLAGPAGTRVEKHTNAFDRETFKQFTSQQALDLLRRSLR